jgi:para-aminobenzoate synthetase component 1
LKEGIDTIDILKATFPGGSITGAPKIRAMEIIDELEPTRRSVYTGSIGYLGFNGDLDLNIAIRTFIVKDGRAYFQVGGGVVYDSDPESEYQETLYKARALIDALNM